MKKSQGTLFKYFKKGEIGLKEVEETGESGTSTPLHAVASSSSITCMDTTVTGESTISATTTPGGEKMKNQRNFKKEWIQKYPWILHKDEKIFCNICRSAKEIGMAIPKCSKNEISSYQAFVEEGFKNFKKAHKRFASHEQGMLHKSSVAACAAVKSGVNVQASIEKNKTLEMVSARKALRAIITSIRYLAGQGLPLRGHNDSKSNLWELLKLRAEDNADLKKWLSRESKFKWISHENIDELVDILSLSVQRKVASFVNSADFFAIMMDETADISQKEQVAICLRVVERDLTVTEYFIGFYETSSTTSETLTHILKDVLVRLNTPISKCRGQCYDGAASMSGKLSGVQKRVREEEPRAIYVHCAAHNLNLVVEDSINCTAEIRNFISLTKEMIVFVKGSPKRLSSFEKIQAASDEDEKSINLRNFCPTRWCLRISSLKTVKANLSILLTFFEELSATDPKAAGFLKFIKTFEFIFFLNLAIEIFSKIEVLNEFLQKPTLNFQNITMCLTSLIDTLRVQREDGFDQIWISAEDVSKQLGISGPIVPRIRKLPSKLDENKRTAYHHAAPRDKYKQLFVQIVDQATQSLLGRFDSFTSGHLQKMERFLLKLDESPENVTKFYREDFDGDRLTLHRDMLLDIARTKNKKLESLSEVIDFLVESGTMELIPEIWRFTRLLLTIPVSSCTAERAFSSLRRLKTYLRSTMGAKRLNNIAVLSVYKEMASEVDIDCVANEFISRTAVRRNTFSLH